MLFSPANSTWEKDVVCLINHGGGKNFLSPGKEPFVRKIGILALCAALSCGAQVEAQIYYPNRDTSPRSGGVGDTSYDAMEDAQNNYSFKAVFTGEKGIYLSNVGVQIIGRRGQEFVNGTTDGPMLLADLPPGPYVLNASAEGFEKTQKFKISKKQRLKTIYVRFPISDEDSGNYGYRQNEQHWDKNNYPYSQR
jgi:hypothetical protein